MPEKNEMVRLTGWTIEHQTKKALLVKFGDREIWLPKSQVELSVTGGQLRVAEWLIGEKSLAKHIADDEPMPQPPANPTPPPQDDDLPF